MKTGVGLRIRLFFPSDTLTNVVGPNPIFERHLIPLRELPPITAIHALAKRRHRLISTPNLDLEERGLITIATLSRALHPALLGIIPCSGTAEDIFTLLALVEASRVYRLGDCMLERTGAAFETVGAIEGEGDGKDVGAMGTDCGTKLEEFTESVGFLGENEQRSMVAVV